jgi:hypothetical protein
MRDYWSINTHLQNYRGGGGSNPENNKLYRGVLFL